MMLWWKYQQLRSSNLKTRLATIAQLAESKNKDSVGPLLFALKDKDEGIRSAAALALGQFQDKKTVEPLIKMLADPAPLVRGTTAEVLAKLQEPSAIPPLINLLRDPDPAVRVRASSSLDRFGWQPENETERTWHIVASGNLKRMADLGSDAVELLADLMRTSEPQKQLFAVKALGEIEDPRVPGLMLEALKIDHILVRLAALELLQHFADPANYEVVENLLKDSAVNIRAAAVSAVVSCGGVRAVPSLIGLLKDVSWEVRREAIKALGKLGDPAAIDGLARALQDRDHDVRETAAVALGRIRDARAIGPLVLALLDIESFVRNAAANSLKDINPKWEKTDAARGALPQVQAARKHREYWISHSAARLLERISVDGTDEMDVPAEVMAMPIATPPEIISRPATPPKLPPDVFSRSVMPASPSPEIHMPVENSAKQPVAAFDILAELLGDRDRDLRLAAAEAFGQLREKRAASLLATTIHDGDDFVRQAAGRALAALN